jgi:methylthioxylose transferase
VAILVMTDRDLRLSSRAALILATGAGFLAFVLAGWLVSGANPFIVWRWNLHHHARFYDDFHRTYSLWLWANVIELAIAIGLPTVVWAFVGLLAPRTVPRAVWATLFVLILVNLTGRNMGEVARLWMLYTPPFLIAAARGLERVGGGPVALAVATALVGLQTLALQSMIQVVYPV